MQVKRIVSAMCAGVMVLVLGACAVPDKAPERAPLTGAVLAGTEWTVFAVDGLPEVVNPKPKLRWDLSERVAGTGGCNAFGAPSFVTKDSFRVGPLVPVGKMCLTLPGGQEDLFFKAMEQVRKGRWEQDQLVLTDTGGKPLLRLFQTK